MSSAAKPQHFMETSGATDPVWVLKDKYGNRPSFPALDKDIETDVCVIGSGIAGVSVAYELVTRGKEVVLVEARHVLSGETGRTSGHLSSALDDGYVNIRGKHGQAGAQAAADSHSWALNRVGEIAQKLGIQCEYRHLPGYHISQYTRGDKKHEEDMKELKEEAEFAQKLGLQVSFQEDLTIKGWDGKPDQRGGIVWGKQATFWPTSYVLGVLKWLTEQPNFKCYTLTRVMSVEEQSAGLLGLGHRYVTVQTEAGRSIRCADAVMATCVPLQKLSLIAEMEYNRTYCIAIRVPKGSVEDCLIYDTAEEYKYVRVCACDEKDDYMVVGGCDHKVGQETPAGRFEELEAWVRERFTKAGAVDYRWSGQIFEPVDYMAFIGKETGCSHTYVVTGDSGNGLTHGVLAGRLIADEIECRSDETGEWAKLYSPKRLASLVKSAKDAIAHDLQINTQYKRLLQSDIADIEDLAPGTGGVLNPTLSKPVAVYKDEKGEVVKMSALCPHLKGVVCWNPAEKSFDCPVHGSRFSESGLCVQGPAKGNLERM